MIAASELQNNADELLNRHLAQWNLNRSIAGGAMRIPINETLWARFRRRLYVRRLWLRYALLSAWGAPYPPRVDTRVREKFSWFADLRLAMKNPPPLRRRQIL